MKELFSLNSPWVKRFAMLTNLVILNLLWLVCCIPVFTIGAATAALYQKCREGRSHPCGP